MPPHRQPLFQIPSWLAAGRLPRALAASAGLLVAGALAPGPLRAGVPGCGGRFRMSSQAIVFDGIGLDVVRLEAGAVALRVFTFGAWSIDDAGDGTYGIALRHERWEGVRAGICALAPVETADDRIATPAARPDAASRPDAGSSAGAQRDPAAPADAAPRKLAGFWGRYVGAVAAELGSETQVLDERDSQADEAVVEVLGWRTREALFVAPSLDGTRERAELHVVATDSGRGRGAAFVLQGPRDEVEKAMRDFRFLLSRLAAE